MAIQMIMRWEGITPAQYDEARKIVNWEGDAPTGLQDPRDVLRGTDAVRGDGDAVGGHKQQDTSREASRNRASRDKTSREGVTPPLDDVPRRCSSTPYGLASFEFRIPYPK